MNKIEYGNKNDMDIFYRSLTKEERNILIKCIEIAGCILKKCDLGNHVSVEYKYSAGDQMKAFIGSYTDTGEYDNPAFMQS